MYSKSLKFTRFFKYFNRNIKLPSKIIKTKVGYFFRNTKLKADIDLSNVKNRLIKNKKLYMSNIIELVFIVYLLKIF